MSKPSNKPPVLMPVYNRFGLGFERGEGVYLFDDQGGKYLDFATGIAVNSLGHCHPHAVKALQNQAEKLWHTSNLFHIPLQEKFAARLVDATFADSVFFTNSGVEAIECAIKVARRYHNDRGNPERNEIISFENAFHGRSLAAIAASGKPKMTEGFAPIPEGFVKVAFLDLKKVKDSISEKTAAIMIEPVQGEGGIVPVKKEDLQALRKMADEAGILLMFDEIQCGMGRTGKLFAQEWAGVEPDVMTVAKGIGTGFPLGACLAKGSVGEVLVPGTHGTTYGGNPLAMAVGNAVLDIILEKGFLDHVQAMSNLLFRGLADLKEAYPKIIKDVRGLGLMIGVECAVKTRPLIEKGHGEGLVLAPSGTHVMRLLPPLIIDESHVKEALEKLDRVLRTV